MVGRRQGLLSLSMIAIMLIAVQIPFANQQVQADVGNKTYSSQSCLSAVRPVDSPIYVDTLNGSDGWNGTSSCPKSTIGGAIQDASASGEIVIHAGVYHENVTIDNLDGLTIRAATGERVVIDGTKSITGDFNATWHNASNGIQYVDLPEHGWQLFLDRSEQVPARWPNANFDDGTVFNRSHNWAHGTITNSNNAYTNGWLTDAGAVTGGHGGLLASGIDPVGAIAILNVASFRSYSRMVTSWNSSNETIGFDLTDEWRTKHHAYFLEGKRELIDVDGEWWYNDTSQRLHYKTPASQDANDLDLRIKTQPYAFTVTNSDDVALENLEFFGTTARFDGCEGCSIEDSIMRYPSTSKRGLNIAGEAAGERWVTKFDRCSYSLVENTAILYTDGTAIEFHGAALQSHNNTINDSYFHHIDWSVSDLPGLMVTIYDGGRDNSFTNSTIHRTGASATLSIGDAPTVMHNEVWNTGLLQTDGAVVQMMQNEQQDADIAYNWIHDTDKYGIRMDGPMGGTNTGRNASVHHNVLWNVSGAIMVKGDYHSAHNNTVLWDDRGKNHIIVLHEDEAGNENSSIWNNAADSISAHRSQTWDAHPLQNGTYAFNWNGYRNSTSQPNVSSMLVDPDNRDFRPLAYSELDDLGAGAYEALDSNPWVPGMTWAYREPSNPLVGCLDPFAENYDQNAVFSSGECEYAVIVVGEVGLVINATVNSQENHVEIGVDFSNVTAEDEYEYEIWFTRVDPDYKHQSFTGNIEPEYGGTTYRVDRTWTPSQDGPYTVHCVVRPATDDPDWDIANGNDTFGWGDVANNSQAPNVEITPNPDQTHYDLFGNSSLADAVTIELDAVGTESGASYNIRWKLYKEGVNDSLIGQTENTQHRNFVMSNLIVYFENNSNYTLTSWLLRMDQSSTGGPTENVLGDESWSFAIGEEPEVTIDPVISGCMDENATNYDENATVDDGSCEFLDTDGDGIFDHLEVEGCTDSNASNFDEDATDDDGSCEFDDTDGDGIFDHLEVEGCTDSNASNFDEDATDDDGSCEFDDTDGDGVFDHLEIKGCTDSNATNYNQTATDQDGSCIYPEPLDVTLTANRTTGDAPLDVSFFADITGGESPFEILWNFGDGVNSDQGKVNHTFSAGVYEVVLQVADNDGDTLERSIQIVATEPPVIDNLTGYLVYSGQLEPITKGMVATIEFIGTASGGEGPYTFTWQFGDSTMDNGSIVLHEYAKEGEFAIRLTIEDSAGRTLQLEDTINITANEDEDNGEISQTQEGLNEDDSNFDIYATGTGVIGLLLIFGLFGRKRRESFLEAERRKMHGEGSIWDER